MFLTIKFQTHLNFASSFSFISVVGDIPELGCWEKTLKHPLKPSDYDSSRWVSIHRLKLVLITSFEFKFVLVDNDNIIEWEDLIPNRKFDVVNYHENCIIHIICDFNCNNYQIYFEEKSFLKDEINPNKLLPFFTKINRQLITKKENSSKRESCLEYNDDLQDLDALLWKFQVKERESIIGEIKQKLENSSSIFVKSLVCSSEVSILKAKLIEISRQDYQNNNKFLSKIINKLCSIERMPFSYEKMLFKLMLEVELKKNELFQSLISKDYLHESIKVLSKNQFEVNAPRHLIENIDVNLENWEKISKLLYLISKEIQPLNIYDIMSGNCSETMINALKDKDILLFLGNCESGKTTLCELLRCTSEAKFNKIKTMEYEENIKLTYFSINYGSRELVICDGPGFSCDPELEILYFLDLKRILKTCKSVKPVLVISSEDIATRALGKNVGIYTLISAIDEMICEPKENLRNKFSYIFTNFNQNKEMELIPKLIEIKRSLLKLNTDNEGFISFLSDMTKKLKNKEGAVVIDLKELKWCDKNETLASLNVIEKINDPEFALSFFCSASSKKTIKSQIQKIELAIPHIFSSGNIILLNHKLKHLKFLSEELKFEMCSSSYTLTIQSLTTLIRNEFENQCSIISKELSSKEVPCKSIEELSIFFQKTQDIDCSDFQKNILESEIFNFLDKESNKLLTTIKISDSDCCNRVLSKIEAICNFFPLMTEKYQEGKRIIADLLASELAPFSNNTIEIENFIKTLEKSKAFCNSLSSHLKENDMNLFQEFLGKLDDKLSYYSHRLECEINKLFVTEGFLLETTHYIKILYLCIEKLKGPELFENEESILTRCCDIIEGKIKILKLNLKNEVDSLLKSDSFVGKTHKLQIICENIIAMRNLDFQQRFQTLFKEPLREITPLFEHINQKNITTPHEIAENFENLAELHFLSRRISDTYFNCLQTEIKKLKLFILKIFNDVQNLLTKTKPSEAIQFFVEIQELFSYIFTIQALKKILENSSFLIFKEHFAHLISEFSDQLIELNNQLIKLWNNFSSLEKYTIENIDRNSLLRICQCYKFLRESQIDVNELSLGKLRLQIENFLRELSAFVIENMDYFFDFLSNFNISSEIDTDSFRAKLKMLPLIKEFKEAFESANVAFQYENYLQNFKTKINIFLLKIEDEIHMNTFSKKFSTAKKIINKLEKLKPFDKIVEESIFTNFVVQNYEFLNLEKEKWLEENNQHLKDHLYEKISLKKSESSYEDEAWFVRLKTKLSDQISDFCKTISRIIFFDLTQENLELLSKCLKKLEKIQKNTGPLIDSNQIQIIAELILKTKKKISKKIRELSEKGEECINEYSLFKSQEILNEIDLILNYLEDYVDIEASDLKEQLKKKQKEKKIEINLKINAYSKVSLRELLEWKTGSAICFYNKIMQNKEEFESELFDLSNVFIRKIEEEVEKANKSHDDVNEIKQMAKKLPEEIKQKIGFNYFDF